MKPSQLALFLAKAIAAREPALIVGGPGIGKTSIVEQAAAAAKAAVVISHPAVADPTDAKGMPWMEKGAKHAEFKPFGELALVLESKEPTVWFMDDLGQAPPAVQAAYMPWLLARRCGEHCLPDHVTIFAATNRRTDRAGVSGILEPVKSRFATIVTLEPDLDEWSNWAVTQSNIPPELVAFLRFRRELLYNFVPSADLTNCPLPRTWAAAGRLVSLRLPADIEAAALAGAVGEGAATEFMGFLQMFRQLPNIDLILADPASQNIPTQTSVLYAVSTALASRANDKTFPKIATYAQRLVDKGHGEFAALLLRDSTRRAPSIMTTPAFVRLGAGELGSLIGGGVQ
jgi:hypothetical protein